MEGWYEDACNVQAGRGFEIRGNEDAPQGGGRVECAIRGSHVKEGFKMESVQYWPGEIGKLVKLCEVAK